MDIEEVRAVCLGIHQMVEEGCPFRTQGYDDVAFTICGKIFAYLLVDDSRMVVTKCDAERAIDLRERYAGLIEPAFHWNKKYWNQLHYDRLPAALVEELLHHAYDEVVRKLPRRLQAQVAGQ